MFKFGRKNVLKMKAADLTVIVKSDDRELVEKIRNAVMSYKFEALKQRGEEVVKQAGVVERPASSEQPKSRPKALPLAVGGEHSTFKVHELVGAPTPIVTPKETCRLSEDGVTLLYRVKYKCANPQCGHEGYRFAPHTNKYIKCHSCGAKLHMVPATKTTFYDDRVSDEVPHADTEGNHFRANKLYIPPAVHSPAIQ